MNPSTIVVTGAGPDSIGLATAQALADQGHQVLVSTRSDPVPGFAWHPLDLADPGSVKAFADWTLAQVDDRLDALVNNAGIHLDLRSKWAEPRLASDGHEVHWRTNYLGTVQLTRLLLPVLLGTAGTRGDARLVHVVSKLHARGSNEALLDGVQPYDSWSAYGTSKLGLVHDVVELDRRYAADGLRAMAVHPGSVFTRIADAGLANSPVLGRLRRLGRPLERRMLLTPEQGAATTVHCLTEPTVEGGRYYRRSAVAEPSSDALDAEVSRRLWERTDDWLTRMAHR